MSSPERDGRTHYIHRLSYTAQERLVGAFVLSGFVLLLLLVVFSREAQTLFADKFTLQAYMNNAQGVTVDTEVLISGVEVGRVRSLDVTENNVIRVEMELLERFHSLVREDSRAALSKLSMIGKPSIEIRAGNPSLPELPDGGTVALAESLSIDQLMTDLAPAMKNFLRILERFDQVAQAVDPQDVGGTARNLNTASGDLPALVNEMQRVVAQLNTTMGTVNYEMQQLPDLVLRSRQLMEQLDRTLYGAQNTWPLSSSVPPPPEQQLVDPRPMP